MGLVTLPNPTFASGTQAIGTEVIANFQAILDEVNGSIEDANIANASITGSTKLKAASVTSSELSVSSVHEFQMHFDASGLGVLAARVGPNYRGTTGGRLSHVFKAVTTTANSSPQTVSIVYADDCVDGPPGYATRPTSGGICITLDSASPADIEVPTGYLFNTTANGCDVRLLKPSGTTATDLFIEFSLWQRIS